MCKDSGHSRMEPCIAIAQAHHLFGKTRLPRDDADLSRLRELAHQRRTSVATCGHLQTRTWRREHDSASCKSGCTRQRATGEESARWFWACQTHCVHNQRPLHRENMEMLTTVFCCLFASNELPQRPAWIIQSQSERELVGFQKRYKHGQG